MATIVEFPEIKIIYVKAINGVRGSKEAFDKLESKLSTLKGRKFYGLVFGTPPNDEYWASVALKNEDKPEESGFEIGSIPGGKYVQERIYDWNNQLDLIGETFKKLTDTYNVDTSRPYVEFYRSTRDMLVRLPVK